MYGYVGDQPAPLYDVSYDHITFLFDHGDYPVDSLMGKVIDIAVEGYWDADAINFFHDEATAFINEHTSNFVSAWRTQDTTEQKLVLRFFLDGPCHHKERYAQWQKTLHAYPQAMEMLSREYQWMMEIFELDSQ